MSGPDISDVRSFSEQLAVKTGRLLKKGFSQSKKVRYKGRIDPVTEFDVRAEQLIVDKIARRFPDHEILAEEGTNRGRRSNYRWIIDPLDGTVNYAHGFPVYCVSIAVEYDSEVIAGSVYDPERDELFSTGKNMGARLNGSSIQVTDESRLERALLATGFAYDIGTARRNNLGLFARMAKQCQGIRRPGSAAIDLCWLAAGRIDGFWELKLHPWDTAAACLLVEEAGGRISRLNGDDYSIFDKDLLASNGPLHSKMKAVLSP